MTRHFIYLLLIPLLFQVTGAQEITGISSVYDDSFTDWTIYAEDNMQGRLEPVYRLNNEWEQWNYRLGERSGYLKQKFENNPGLWELSNGTEIITMRPIFPGDYRSWRITDDDITLEISSVYGGYPVRWRIEGDFGSLVVEQIYEGDPRDWVVYDQLNASISWEMRLAAVGIAVLHSIPKY